MRCAAKFVTEAREDAGDGANMFQAMMKERIGGPIFETFLIVVERIAVETERPADLELHALSLIGLSMVFHFHHAKAMDILDCSGTNQHLIAKPVSRARNCPMP